MSSTNSAAGTTIDSREPLWDLTPSEGWPADNALPPAAYRLIQTAQDRQQLVSCFDFVPSNYVHAWHCIQRLANLCDANTLNETWLQETAWARYVRSHRSAAGIRFCEWGSGWGVVAGLASLAGFDAGGIEQDENLSRESGRMLQELGLKTRITCGSYFAIDQVADIYYVYAWPSQRSQLLDRFMQLAPAHALLLLCDGQDRLRVLTRWP